VPTGLHPTPFRPRKATENVLSWRSKKSTMWWLKGRSLTLLDQLSHNLKRVDVGGSLIGSKPQDPWESQSIPALVTLRLLDSIASHFNYDFWLDEADASVGKFADSMRAKPFGQIG
jgi:hypothetical protein